jgi:hypothetical protein
MKVKCRAAPLLGLRMDLFRSTTSTLLIWLLSGLPMTASIEKLSPARLTAEKNTAAAILPNTLLDGLLAGRVFKAVPLNLVIDEPPNGSRPVYTRPTIFADILAYGLYPKKQKYFVFRSAASSAQGAFEIVFFDDDASGFSLTVPSEKVSVSNEHELSFSRNSTIGGDGVTGSSVTIVSFVGNSRICPLPQISVSITVTSKWRDVFTFFLAKNSSWQATMQLEPAEIPESLLTAAKNISMDLRQYNKLEEEKELQERSERRKKLKG